MTPLSLPFEVFADGNPAPKGSVTPNRGGRGVRHTKRSKSWHGTVVDAILRKLWMPDGRFVAGVTPTRVRDVVRPDPIATPVGVLAEFVIRKPAGNADPVPTTMWVGDLDKHARSLLDALTGAKVIEDDSLVTELHVTKRWAADVERCGVHIVVHEPTATLIARAMRGLLEERAEVFDQLAIADPSPTSQAPLTAEKLHAAIDKLRPSKYFGEAPTVGMLRNMEAELNARRDAFSPHDPMAGIDGRYPARRRADLGVPFGSDNEFG